jgi:hypothetical protein
MDSGILAGIGPLVIATRMRAPVIHSCCGMLNPATRPGIAPPDELGTTREEARGIHTKPVHVARIVSDLLSDIQVNA